MLSPIPVPIPSAPPPALRRPPIGMAARSYWIASASLRRRPGGTVHPDVARGTLASLAATYAGHRLGNAALTALAAEGGAA
ncbi:hypothetical protein P7L78_19200 [Tistrella bauzanensis]|uniref:hypothetical protein n=1 Tax=Tistrella TaxID=171436 RepID=UPI0031F6AF27